MEDNILQGDSKQRVAFDLMCEIAEEESKERFGKPDPRTYYLTLYHQCLKAVSGNAIDEVLGADTLARRAINLG